MSQSVVELAKELTMALVQTGRVAPDDMQETLQTTYATFTALKAQEEFGVFAPAPVSETVPVDWRKSITKHAVTCLECGQAFKQLSRRHLSMHGLDSRSYRTKYGIPRTRPLSARSITERRRQVAQETRPWEKAPHVLQAREHNGHTSPEPDGEAVSETAEEPSAGSSTQTTQGAAQNNVEEANSTEEKISSVGRTLGQGGQACVGRVKNYGQTAAPD